MVLRFLYSCYLNDKCRIRKISENYVYMVERWRYNSVNSIDTRNKMLLNTYVTKKDVIEGTGLSESQEYEWSVLLKPIKKERGVFESLGNTLDRFFK